MSVSVKCRKRILSVASCLSLLPTKRNQSNSLIMTILRFVAFLFTLSSICAYSAEPKAQSLFCSGQTNLFAGTSRLTDTNALILIGDKTFVEVHGVGQGYSAAKLKMITGMMANMAVTLKPAYEGGSELTSQLSLNVYSGALSIIYYDQEKRMQTAFEGVCKKTGPIIKL